LGGGQTDIIGNIYKRLPENSKEITTYSAHDPKHIPGHPSIYLKGNTGPSQPNPKGNNWRMVSGPVSQKAAPLSPPAFPITIHPVKVLEKIVLADVGNSRRLDANGKWVARRDSVDTRLIKEYRTNKGILPYHEDEVGGWPVIAPGTPYTDTDNDGMPDAWEIKYGLNPNDPGDANQDANGNGYTNIEEFLNGTNPLNGNPAAAITTQPVSK